MNGVQIDVSLELTMQNAVDCAEWTALIGVEAADSMTIYDAAGSVVARDGGLNDEDGRLNGKVQILGMVDALYSFRIESDVSLVNAVLTLSVEECPTTPPSALPTSDPRRGELLASLLLDSFRIEHVGIAGPCGPWPGLGKDRVRR